ncbi:ADP-ribose pyrophosphatase [Agromyces badenianii]|uniref:ADP-ribose pyrophosphatase n=1 Tax=Agromyces badenianii TaxID=2080742 RepID=A0A2S0WV97_9MICO|nr:NUDIX hydrolase [Agromyces badenianii]AWB95265.1 ADP-ribose pyrophosphatase [Agromyces badenianii]PWC02850.1 NUDIX hydrolase [Agromyces badenianii]
MADSRDTGVGERLEPLADERVEVPIVASERVFDGRVWDIRRDAFEFGGETIVREYMDHTGAVGVLALDDEDRALLIKQYRHPVRLRDWEIPAGLLDVDGESPLAAAKRELAEEADLEASEWAVLTDFATSPGGSDEVIRVYLARGLTAAAEAFAREGEEADMETRWVALDDCVDAVLDRRIHNAPLSIAVLAAAAARARGWSTLGEADAPWPGRAVGRSEPSGR